MPHKFSRPRQDVVTGDTLCDEKAPIILERMEFPEPVIKIAIEPKSKGDLEKMTTGLIKLAQEDPSFRFSRDEETNQTTIEGMGELHLEIIVDRLKREFKVRVRGGGGGCEHFWRNFEGGNWDNS